MKFLRNMAWASLALVLVLATPLGALATADRAFVETPLTWNGEYLASTVHFMDGNDLVDLSWEDILVSMTDIYSSEEFMNAFEAKIYDYAAQHSYPLTHGVIWPALRRADVDALIASSTSALATVAYSGDYNDLANTPDIPEGFLKAKLVTGTVAGGSGAASIDISAHGFDSIEHVIWEGVDDTQVYTFGSLSSSSSTVSATVKRQVFSGVTVLGVTVLGSVTLQNAPNGTQVRAVVLGY